MRRTATGLGTMDLSTPGCNLGNKTRDFLPPHVPSPIPDILGPSVPSLKPTMGTMAKLHPPELGPETPYSYICAHAPWVVPSQAPRDMRAEPLGTGTVSGQQWMFHINLSAHQYSGHP